VQLIFQQKLTRKNRDLGIAIAEDFTQARNSAGNQKPIGLVSPMEDLKKKMREPKRRI
jgi:hypothetical protein